MSQFDKYKTCKGCPDRVGGCHDDCDGYKSRCEKQKEINDNRRASNNVPTAQHERANINFYKKQKKAKIFKR